jgi:hypothetical protein
VNDPSISSDAAHVNGVVVVMAEIEALIPLMSGRTAEAEWAAIVP